MQRIPNIATVLSWISATISLTTAATCKSPQGTTVDWWILYQQSSMPFFHFYVDSFDGSNILYHPPEEETSVLSQFMDSILTGEYKQYMIYSYDVINVRKIAESLHFPTMLKWMHGILAADNTLSSGVWLLHNNLLFPPFEARDLASPTSRIWYNTVLGDSSDNVFYICLSLDSNSDVKGVLDNILSGNPHILRSQLSPSFYGGKFAQSLLLQTSTFSLEESALLFMECLNATKDETLTKCLFRFSSKGDNPVTVITRSRGALKQSRGLCYDTSSLVTKNLVSVTNSNPETKGFTDMTTMFVLSNDPMTPAYGVTCFGQDVAEYSEIVTIMICVKLPTLHQELVKSSLFTNILCSGGHQETENTVSVTNAMKNELSSSLLDGSPSTDPDDSCNKYSCSSIIESEDPEEESMWKNPLLKSNKLSEIKEGISSNTQLQHQQQNSKTLMKLRARDFVQRYETINFAFSYIDCRYCQLVKELFHGMSQDFTNCVFLIVDANMPTLPRHLRVPFTPLVRGRTPDSWVNFVGEKHDILSLTSFLSMQLRGVQSESDYREEQQSTKDVKSNRRKRSLGYWFQQKHVSTFEKMGGAIPNYTHVDEVSKGVMTNARGDTMIERGWRTYDDITNFAQTYIVARNEIILTNYLDLAIQNAIYYTIAFNKDIGSKRKRPIETCIIPEKVAKLDGNDTAIRYDDMNSTRYDDMNSTTDSITEKPKCREGESKTFKKYYKCDFSLADLSNSDDIMFVNMVWRNKIKTCKYSKTGTFTLGAGKSKYNANDYKINHLENTRLGGSEDGGIYCEGHP
ncbi:hypothetical protein FSP39_016188 [Pinctada imbricata]|uniref:Thioredoxin domain-containing protein n=1 Tax=Pinctada imbricata TaxID=66713 RepID=A0AA89BWM6_PINIB|nr:hypothetical protein FSP39_016188 [Pinctada imbricata]